MSSSVVVWVAAFRKNHLIQSGKSVAVESLCLETITEDERIMQNILLICMGETLVSVMKEESKARERHFSPIG